MTTLRVPGTEETCDGVETHQTDRLGGVIKVRRKGAVRMDAARAAKTGDSVTVDNVGDDDVIEVELDGGVKIWTTLGQFREDFGVAPSRGEPGVVAFPTELALGSPSRGLGTWILKALRIFDVDVSGVSAVKIAEKLEDRLQPGPGLYQCCRRDRFELRSSGEEVLPSDQPMLVLLHGTASSTEGSFGELWTPEAGRILGRLCETYGDAMFAYEHRTLTQSPIENALELAQKLPAGARLHLVSHSRGGLVGELLCRGARAGEPFDQLELDLFADSEGQVRSRDRAALTELNRLLQKKRFQIERFVRVACPARGTTLAARRLDRWLSIILNLVGMIPGFKGNPVYELLSDFLLAVAKERTDPATLPGLEAMMPESPLIRMLNRPGVTVAADLTVIAGDVQSSGILDRLKFLIADLYYKGEHDLVVDTHSMRGGAERINGGRLFFNQGPEVNHFRYFRNSRSADMILAGLAAPAASLQAGFQPLVTRRNPITERSCRKVAGPRPVVFVLPGIMGSHLGVKGDCIWLDFLALAFGGLSKLVIGAKRVEPQALVGKAYGDLIDYLGASHEVMPFPYDWRQSLQEEGRRLGKSLAQKLDEAERNDQPVRILAHSMGGLLARAMITECPEVWERIIRHPGGRLIMLGTPNKGSFVIPRMLMGQERLMRMIAMLDFRHSHKELLRVVSQYPGVLEMLPVGEDIDFFSPDTWQQFHRTYSKGWVLPDAGRLEEARRFRSRLDACPLDGQRMFYVAGRARATPFAIACRTDARDEERICFHATPYGDGRVTWAGGIPDGVRTWYMDAEHGDMADHQPAFGAILDLLQRGDTVRLSTAPLAVARGMPESFPLPPDSVSVFPDYSEVEAAALGSHTHLKPVEKTKAVDVSVVHGNLAFASYPVAVGHYQGDTIISAEAHLDHLLRGRLRQRHRLGLYPGGLETSAIFLTADREANSAGAIVIGLGSVGELTPNTLTHTFTRALLDYALMVAESTDDAFAGMNGAPRPVTVSSLLIGTGAGGIRVEDSVIAILRAVHRAGLALQDCGLHNRVLIESIEFIELWEDRAIQAARVLSRINDDPELRHGFACQPLLRRVSGSRSRVVYEEAQGWWQRMQVHCDGDGALRFNAMTGRARAEIALLPTQRSLVDGFIARAIRTTQSDRAVGKTLFEMLIPNRLKEEAPDRQDLIMVLNEEAAAYPWELLEDRASEGGWPLAVENGLLRQLETEVFREWVSTTPQNTALVIGDPVSDLVPLPGAQEEADIVWELLAKHGFNAGKAVCQTAQTIVEALHADAYRILHLAGHGVYQYPVTEPGESCGQCGQTMPQKKLSGMVLGKGVFLTPADVEQMREVPELVFINCCHLGRIENQDANEQPAFHKLAANLAAQFIRMGVRAVIAAGWAVDDVAAKTFARTFYEQLLGGAPFGRAVSSARRRTYEQHKSVNTWGAYQCYGDPDYTLAPRVEDDKVVQYKFNPVSTAEALAELNNLVGDAETVPDEKLSTLRRYLSDLEQSLPPDWLADAQVRAALGAAYGEVESFKEAVEHYLAALALKDANLPVKAIEQLGNLQARWAVQLWKTPGEPAGPPVDMLIGKAIEHIGGLLKFAKTSERLCLMASIYKRQAWVHSKDDPKASLEQMRAYFKEAHELELANKGEVAPYPLLNWLLAETILRWRRSGKDEAFDMQRQDLIAEAESIASRNSEDPTFWSAVSQAECMLFRHLVEENLDEHKEAIVQAYQRARFRGVSARKFRSVLGHLEFLIEMVKAEGRIKTRKRILGEPLEWIYQQLADRGV